MKKLVTLMLLMSVLLAIMPGIGSAASASVPTLFLNGKQLETKAAPRIVQNSTIVPIRVVAEGLGYDVTWNQQSRTVKVFNGETEVQFVIDQKNALVNGKAVKLSAPAIVDGDTTFIPLRFVSENMGLDVVWDQPSKSVMLYSSEPTPSVDPTVPPPGSGGGTAADPVTGGDGGAVSNPGTGGGGVLPEIPADAIGVLTDVEFDGIGRIAVKYSGDMAPNPAFWSGTKLVVDIPYASLDPAVMAALTAAQQSQGEVYIGMPGLEKVRYAYYSDKPSTVRVVLDMNAQYPYTVTQNDGEIDIDVDLSAAPVLPPVVPVDNPVTPDGKQIYKIVIDAGHGAKDPGAKSVTGRTEKEFNLAVVLKIKKLLDQEPRLQAYLTRSDDTFVELNDRASYANNLGADVFVSIHGNSYTPSATGTETYYNRTNSKSLADIVHKHVVASLGLPDRNVRQAGFVVIKKTTMPAILLESGYLSNKGDEKVLYSEDGQNRIAAAVVAGIKEFLKVQ